MCLILQNVYSSLSDTKSRYIDSTINDPSWRLTKLGSSLGTADNLGAVAKACFNLVPGFIVGSSFFSLCNNNTHVYILHTTHFI